MFKVIHLLLPHYNYMLAYFVTRSRFFNEKSVKMKLMEPTAANWTLNSTHAMAIHSLIHHHNRFTAPFPGPPGEPVPEENFWTLWCKGRLTEPDTPVIRLDATPSGLTSAHLHHSPHFFTGRMLFLPPNQQCQSTEGN